MNKFREKKVDFAAHTNTEDGGAVFLNLLGKACFSPNRLCFHPPLWLCATYIICYASYTTFF